MIRGKLAIAAAGVVAVAAIGLLWLGGYMAKTDAAVRAAEGRTDNIKTGQGIERDVEALGDDAFGRELDDRLQPADH